MKNMILQYPRPAEFMEHGPSLWLRFKDAIKLSVYSFFKKIGFPGAVNNMEIHDEVTGQHLKVDVGILFTRISVNGRDYYFNRFSGKFDGTGMGCTR